MRPIKGEGAAKRYMFFLVFGKIQIYLQQNINLYRQINITTHVLKDPDNDALRLIKSRFGKYTFL